MYGSVYRNAHRSVFIPSFLWGVQLLRICKRGNKLYVRTGPEASGMGLSACRLFPCDRDHHLPSQNTRTGMRPPPSCANDLRGSQPSCRRRFRGCTATPLLMNWSCVGACDLPIAFTHQGGANAEPVEGLLQGADGIGPLRQAEPVGRVPTETSTASKGT